MGLFLIRIFSAVMMAYFHGFIKFQKFDMLKNVFPDPIGLGSALSLYLVIFAELFCSVILISGIYTRLVTIPLIITMFVASFIFHINDPISKIELPLLYLVIYIALFISGPGKYALKGPIPLKNNPIFNWLFKH